MGYFVDSEVTIISDNQIFITERPPIRIIDFKEKLIVTEYKVLLILFSQFEHKFNNILGSLCSRESDFTYTN